MVNERIIILGGYSDGLIAGPVESAATGGGACDFCYIYIYIYVCVFFI